MDTLVFQNNNQRRFKWRSSCRSMCKPEAGTVWLCNSSSRVSIYKSVTSPDKDFAFKIVIIFLSICSKHMFWVLKSIISSRWFFRVPTTYVLVEK